MTALTPGTRLHERFVLVEPIGAGGMAEVWRAEDEVLGRSVAVKFLDARVGGDATRRIATRREAQAAARLTHPNITRVYDYGEADLPDGRSAPYLVMELLNGQGLNERLAGGPLPVRAALTVAGQVAGALAAAHAIGVVHCDVKPGNVMLTETGAKVLDFGIAAITGDVSASGRPLYGTPGYLAPERRAGAEAAPPADVYALGVLLVEVLTGRRPEGGFPTVPGLPPAVARLGAAALSADPAARPAADELARALISAAGPATSLTPAAAAAPTVVAEAVGNGSRPDGTKVMPAAAMVGRASVAPPARPAYVEEPSRPLPPPNRRRLLVATAVALALIVVAAVVIALMNRSDGGADDGNTPNPGVTSQPAGGGEPTTVPTTDPASPEPEPTPTPTPSPSASAEESADPDLAAVETFQQEVDRLAGQGLITADAQEKISERVDQLREAIEEQDDVDREVRDVRKEVTARVDGGPVREQLLTLLDGIGGDR